VTTTEFDNEDPANFARTEGGLTLCLPCQDHQHETCYGGACECDVEVLVRYLVPVWVTVDHDGDVLSVKVEDEAVRYDDDDRDRDTKWAHGRAEAADWPHWEFG
jgi:hypothetical protein